MNTASSPRLSQPRRRAAPALRSAVGVDPADMGTVFGLELSLELEAAARPASAVAATPPWWRRLGRRR
jgi:hypothetical protein